MVLPCAVLTAPTIARAANGSKPRVPVDWGDPACVQLVDRTVTPTLHLSYGIPSEDTGERTADEVADSRTHQFFAFAQQNYGTTMPRWITHADVERAAEVDPMVIVGDIGPQDVLETSSTWPSSTWLRITMDDARLPITEAQAAMGVDWDVSTIAPGTWWVWGYTWEPLNNLWSPRWGAIKVIDGEAQADEAGPTIVLLPDEALLTVGDGYRVPGCVDAMSGSRLTIEWGEVVGTAEPSWQAAMTDVVVESGMLAITFEPPAAAAGQSIRLRATVSDPAGRSTVVYSPKTLVVQAGAGEESGGTGTDSGSSKGSGGGCSIGRYRTSPATGGGFLGLCLFALIRRRSSRERGRFPRRIAFGASAIIVACQGSSAGDGGVTATGSTSAAGESSSGETADTEQSAAPASGPLMCPPGEHCTIVIVSQALDDRVDMFTAAGSGPLYRGAIDLDLKPNVSGDISGEALDEPYGLVIDGQGLGVLLGHYPTRELGSWIWMPHEFLATQTVGTTIAAAEFFKDGSFSAPVIGTSLAEQEPIFALRHPSGRVLIGVFNNDLLTPDAAWTQAGKLLVIDPAAPDEVGRRDLGDVGGGCLGTWSLVALDGGGQRVALACDGDESAVVLDVSAVGTGSVQEAAAAIRGCQADVPFMDKRVRYLAEDGEGGFLLAETPPVATGDEGRLWHFDGTCAPKGGFGTIDGDLFEVRQMVYAPQAQGARWLMASGRTAQHGVHVVRVSAEVPEICGSLSSLEPWYTTDDGETLDPFALTLAPDGSGVAIGIGPRDPASAAGGAGRVLWVPLAAPGQGDLCDGELAGDIVDLTSALPYDPRDPTTWRRAPDLIFVHQW